MKVILNADIENLGRKGEVVDVSDGYGRNYLLPRNMAVKATEGALKHALAMIAAREEAERRARDEAEGVAKGLVGTRVVIAAMAGDEGKLFGSIGPGDIVEGIAKFTGVEVDRKAIKLDGPIKSIGLHQVHVKLHADVEFPLTLDVIPA